MRARIIAAGYEPGSSIAIGIAELEDGRRVRFAGDWRPMREIEVALQNGEEVDVDDLEDWQILGRAE